MIVIDLPVPDGTSRSDYGYGLSHLVCDGRPVVEFPHELDLVMPGLFAQLQAQYLTITRPQDLRS